MRSLTTKLNRDDYRTLILGLNLIIEHRLQGEWKAAEHLKSRLEIEMRPLNREPNPNWAPMSIKSSWPGFIKKEKRSHWSFKRTPKPKSEKQLKLNLKKKLTADEILAGL